MSNPEIDIIIYSAQIEDSLRTLYLQGHEAAELLNPETFNQLNPDQQQELFEVCNVDPQSPNALNLAQRKINHQLVCMGLQLNQNQP